MTVLEDRTARHGRAIDINVVVARADVPAHEAVVVFAGGPGQASTDFANIADGWLRPVRSALDIVFIDQRGTGPSHPLSCPALVETDPASAFGHVFDPEIVRSCRDSLSRAADLTKYTTDDAIADVEEVRASLGYERVSLYGTSYGTRMVQAYMRRFPARVRLAVMDGVVPFDNAIPLTYAASAQQAADRVWAACERDRACHSQHPHIAQDFDALLHRFDAGPVATKLSAPDTAVTVRMHRGDFGYAVRGLLYNASAVTELPEMVGRALASHDFGEFANAYWARAAALDRTLALGQHLSVFCAEDVPFPTDAEIERATTGTFLGRYLFDEYRGACREWERAKIATDARTPVTSRVPTLLISGAFDPVTPPEFAERVARLLPSSTMITVPNGAHSSAPGCPRAAVLYVLERGTLDGAPVVCR